MRKILIFLLVCCFVFPFLSFAQLGSDKFIDYLNSCAHSDGSSNWAWVEVEYGELGVSMTRHNDGGHCVYRSEHKEGDKNKW